MLKAEIDAFIKGIREVSWIVDLFKELKQPIFRFIVFYNDSQNVITIVHNLIFYSRTKYTLLKYHYVRK